MSGRASSTTTTASLCHPRQRPRLHPARSSPQASLHEQHHQPHATHASSNRLLQELRQFNHDSSLLILLCSEMLDEECQASGSRYQEVPTFPVDPWQDSFDSLDSLAFNKNWHSTGDEIKLKDLKK
jgi:hypothetical protein